MPALTIIESPYAGNVEANLEYARRCLLDSFARGEIPWASHLLYPQVLDDKTVLERQTGIQAGFAWGAKADRIAFYLDRGMSAGMMAAEEYWKALGKPIDYRRLP